MSGMSEQQGRQDGSSRMSKRRVAQESEVARESFVSPHKDFIWVEKPLGNLMQGEECDLIEKSLMATVFSKMVIPNFT